jgi:hypothetical protein
MSARPPKSRFIPDDYQKTIFDIDYDRMRALGIQTLLMDLDNTVLPYDEALPGSKVLDLFGSLKKKGFSVVVISNNHEPRVKTFAQAVGCPYVHSAKKPFPWGFRRALRLVSHGDPAEVCVIGDQVMTDVWGGKRLGFRVVLVDALKRGSEKWFTRLNRRWERMALKSIEKRYPDLYESLRLAEKR